MRPDSEIERDVKDELQWDPDLDATDIAVSVKNGVVTLDGICPQLHRQVRGRSGGETRRRRGRRGERHRGSIAERGREAGPRDCARRRRRASRANCRSPRRTSRSSSRMAGSRSKARSSGNTSAIRPRRRCAACKGVKGVSNLIQLKPRARAFRDQATRSWMHSSATPRSTPTAFIVEADGSEVILKGTVRSWIEREEAERVAWSAPGVTKVEDRIVVSP